MSDVMLLTYIRVRCVLGRLKRDEAGEGVISAAIAVLIMAALGALMWVGFRSLWTDTSSRTSSQVARIGS